MVTAVVSEITDDFLLMCVCLMNSVGSGADFNPYPRGLSSPVIKSAALYFSQKAGVALCLPDTQQVLSSEPNPSTLHQKD